MAKHSKIILTAFVLLLTSSIAAQEEPLAEAIEYCERRVQDLSAASELLDKVSGSASEKSQRWFRHSYSYATDCALKLTKRTGKKYELKKDWFGSGYTLKKP